MPVKIKRIPDSSLNGIASNIKVKLNGEKIGALSYEEEMDVDLPEREAELSVSQFLIISNKVTVSDGDHVQISFRKFNMIIGPVLMVMMILIPLLFSIEGVTRLLIMLPFLLAVFFVGICMLKLEVSAKDTQEFSG
ncbi:hypothetical protein [Corticicoccus populi]|uniref:Uncharacterized protein n=1 Tax=Corticicoccus populi TaxID=1812821 RepID=A0ABW5WZW8_9STAP